MATKTNSAEAHPGRCAKNHHDLLVQTWCSATPLYNTSGDASQMEVTLHSPFPRFPAPVCACFGPMMRSPVLCLSVITGCAGRHSWAQLLNLCGWGSARDF